MANEHVLLAPTNRTVDGPLFRSDKSNIVVEYDHQNEDGTVTWHRIVFVEVLAFEYRQASCCREDDFVGANVIRCEHTSPTLETVVSRWRESVGWQEWHLKHGGADRFKRFSMFFDDAACIHVIASKYQVE